MNDGTAVVLDARADDRIEPRDAEAFDAAAQACTTVGWKYRRVGSVEPVLAANLRWLSGYRHRRCVPGAAAELVRTFATPTELLRGVRAVGDPIVVLPTLIHLLWSGRLVAELSAAPLGPHTEVRTR
jgi:hypothetical protein